MEIRPNRQWRGHTRLNVITAICKLGPTCVPIKIFLKQSGPFLGGYRRTVDRPDTACFQDATSTMGLLSYYSLQGKNEPYTPCNTGTPLPPCGELWERYWCEPLEGQEKSIWESIPNQSTEICTGNSLYQGGGGEWAAAFPRKSAPGVKEMKGSKLRIVFVWVNTTSY